jgi:hypothetical protein
MVKADFRATKKAGKKSNPAKQSFHKWSKKSDKLEKSLKKASLKSRKCHRDDSKWIGNRKLGWVALGN